jgi:signal peptidase II
MMGGVSEPPAASDEPGGQASAGPVTIAPAAASTVRLLAVIAPLVLAADIVTKVVAVAELEGRAPVELLGGLVYLQLVRNPGAAFSFATGYTWLLTVIAIGVVVVIIRVSRRLRSTGWAIALGLVLGGALGNLTDRIFRAPGPLQGHVVDIVSVFATDGRVFPVFNLADSSIVCGGILLVLLALLGRELDGTHSGRQAGAGRARTAPDGPAGE